MPRWRTMIEPAGTSCPSPALTPSRWPTLSRPFFELEPAFLWAMLGVLPGSSGLRLCRGLGLGGARLALALRRIRLRVGLALCLGLRLRGGPGRGGLRFG